MRRLVDASRVRIPVPVRSWPRWSRRIPAGIAHGIGHGYARMVEMDGFPLCSIDDVIESKRRSNRAKDRESLPRLEDFARYLKRAATGD